MKKVVCLSILIGSFYFSNAQIKAHTETGESVLLHLNGKWEYEKENSKDSSVDFDGSVPINPSKFTKDKLATYLVKSKKIKIGVFIDQKKWGIEKGTINEAGEYTFTFKGKDAFAVFITEGTEIPIENMEEITLINARVSAPDAEILNKEYRTVNGLRVLCLQMKGTIQGINFMYLNYVYTDETGTVQLSSLTSQKLFPTLKKELENFLNGMVKLKQ